MPREKRYEPSEPRAGGKGIAYVLLSERNDYNPRYKPRSGRLRRRGLCLPYDELYDFPSAGQARLYTYCNIKEDAFDIFGFYTREELDCFEKLLSVGGVGPKAALAILSVVTPDQFTLAVMTQDVKTLTMAQGVGKKLAERIMLELKGKFTPAQMEANVAQMDLASPVRGSKTAEATAALSSLGYSQQEIAAALKGVDVNAMTVEDMVRHALRAMVMQ